GDRRFVVRLSAFCYVRHSNLLTYSRRTENTMTGLTIRTHSRSRYLMCVLTIVGGVASAIPACAGEEHEGAAGMTIHIDPKTGALLKEQDPSGGPLQLTPQTGNALSTSEQGLGEGAIPLGGGEVHLQGRFPKPRTATAEADGKLKLIHLDDLPNPGPSKDSAAEK